ncbi:hypothetical protein F5Y09DRAFT_323665 [Xylaria sp. FL1042]|nr:hypothetical protein F5Y09DRAFT_323665 [Xylaria sp. FL1042]
MGLVERLKRRTPGSSPRTEAVGTTRSDNTRRPKSTTKTRRKHRTHGSTCKRNVILCHTQDAYTSQLSLLVLLNARSYATLRPVHHDDSERTIEFTKLHWVNARIDFSDFLLHISHLTYKETQHTALGYIEALEDSLVDALHLLHSHNISFPVSAENIWFLQGRHHE